MWVEQNPNSPSPVMNETLVTSSSTGIELSCYLKNLKSICKENNLREFYFKFLHRIIVTRKELCLYGIECNSACVYCQEPDSISHTFIHCRWSNEFFSEVIKWFNKENGTSFSLSTTELLFWKLPNKFNPSLPPFMLKKTELCLFIR